MRIPFKIDFLASGVHGSDFLGSKCWPGPESSKLKQPGKHVVGELMSNRIDMRGAVDKILTANGLGRVKICYILWGKAFYPEIIYKDYTPNPEKQLEQDILGNKSIYAARGVAAQNLNLPFRDGKTACEDMIYYLNNRNIQDEMQEKLYTGNDGEKINFKWNPHWVRPFQHVVACPESFGEKLSWAKYYNETKGGMSKLYYDIGTKHHKVHLIKNGNSGVEDIENNEENKKLADIYLACPFAEVKQEWEDAVTEDERAQLKFLESQKELQDELKENGDSKIKSDKQKNKDDRINKLNELKADKDSKMNRFITGLFSSIKKTSRAHGAREVRIHMRRECEGAFKSMSQYYKKRVEELARGDRLDCEVHEDPICNIQAEWGGKSFKEINGFEDKMIESKFDVYVSVEMGGASMNMSVYKTKCFVEYLRKRPKEIKAKEDEQDDTNSIPNVPSFYQYNPEADATDAALNLLKGEFGFQSYEALNAARFGFGGKSEKKAKAKGFTAKYHKPRRDHESPKQSGHAKTKSNPRQKLISHKLVKGGANQHRGRLRQVHPVNSPPGPRAGTVQDAKGGSAGSRVRQKKAQRQQQSRSPARNVDHSIFYKLNKNSTWAHGWIRKVCREGRPLTWQIVDHTKNHLVTDEFNNAPDFNQCTNNSQALKDFYKGYVKSSKLKKEEIRKIKKFWKCPKFNVKGPTRSKDFLVGVINYAHAKELNEHIDCQFTYRG
jgi:hypothetical protein